MERSSEAHSAVDGICGKRRVVLVFYGPYKLKGGTLCEPDMAIWLNRSGVCLPNTFKKMSDGLTS